MDLSPIQIGDAYLAAARYGSGKPTLLIAGLGGRAAFWQNQLSPFSAEMEIILHDHRGTGASTRSKGPYSIANMANDTLALMDALNIPAANLVGHSTGGAIAQYLAIHHPERVLKCVISASWAGPTPFFEALFDLRSKVLKTLGPEAYLEDGQQRGFPGAYLVEHGAEIASQRATRLAAFPGEDIELARIKAVIEHDVRDHLAEIRARCLVICAADDQITPSPLSEELAQAIPNAELTILPTGGHFAPQAVPDIYTPPVLAFLKETP